MSEIRSSTGVNLTMLIARIIIVGGLIPNGLRKISNFQETAMVMAGERQMHPGLEPLFNFPAPHLFLTASITFDILGAVLVILGLKARTVAGFLTAYCILAMSIYHYDMTNPENLRSVMRTVPMFGGLLYIAAVGAGGWSLDAWRARRRGPAN